MGHEGELLKRKQRESKGYIKMGLLKELFKVILGGTILKGH